MSTLKQSFDKVNAYLSESVQEVIRTAIAETEGNEVFFLGKVNQKRLVEKVEVFTRGNKFSTPALLQVGKPGDVVIHNHPSGFLVPSSPDTQIASILGNDGIGFYIVNNVATDIYVVVEPFQEKVIVPLHSEPLVAFFDKQGEIAKLLDNYEHRPQQLEMIKAVAQGVNENKIALIEAGTGTGKTLAYLLPAITYAVNNEEKIVVSTNTINLQEQLILKDLPFLQKALKKPFKAALVKGRSNYACKRKILEADMEPDLFDSESGENDLRAILKWAKGTKEGSKSELSFVPRFDAWERVQSESDTSLKTQCPFYDECFFYNARRKAASANILIVNHHLLFSDLALRSMKGMSENAILPGYNRIVFDEAHNIEEIATSYFGTQATLLGLRRIISRLYRKKQNKETGILPFLNFRLGQEIRLLSIEAFIELQQEITTAQKKQLPELQITIDSAFEMIDDFVANSRFVKNFDRAREIKLRLTEEVVSEKEWVEMIVPIVQKLVSQINRFTVRFGKVIDKLNDYSPEFKENTAALTLDLRAQIDRLRMMSTEIQHVLLTEDESHVRWIETRDGYKNSRLIRLQSAPLKVDAILKDALYDRFKSITMTSATLTVAGRFKYLKSRLGLSAVDQEKLIELRLSAPFDYENQALVTVTTDMPAPNDPQFADQLPQFLLDALATSHGRAFVLFTSYALMRRTYNGVKSELETRGVNIYMQGDENRTRLLDRFRKDISSVLFGTDSFWEGVDVHGNSLVSIIITKLPFRVPSEPLVEARIEALEKAGENAFLAYSVPQAAIKFRQGFGRLIRRKTDYGSVLVLDNRLVTKFYGKAFMDSLPNCEKFAGSGVQVIDKLRAFHEKRSANSA